MKTPIVDQMLKSLTWQTENSHFTTQRDIDLVSELKYLKEQLILSGVSHRRELLDAFVCQIEFDTKHEDYQEDIDYFLEAHKSV